MFERLVVGVTHASSAKDAAGIAGQVASAFDAELHVVTAFDPADGPAAADRADDLLRAMAMASGRPMQLHTRPGDPVEAICGVAAEVGADLIIVGNRGLAEGSRWSKSVPGEVSRRASCSVLILDTI